MAEIKPFRALRPRPALAPNIAAVPYDVVSTEEARALANGNPLSFLRVSRAEIELDPTADPYSDRVYERAAGNFERLTRSSFVVEDEPSLYVYRLKTEDHEQTGIAACFSLDEYEHGVIKKHERTRPDKETDRTRHILALNAQTGVVFLVYRGAAELQHLTADAVLGEPLVDFEAEGTVHTIWRVDVVTTPLYVQAFGRIPALYIADGHHRAAAALRARAAMKQADATSSAIRDDADVSTMLAVAFPHDQVRILPYNRIVNDLGGLSQPEFLERVDARFHIAPGRSARPSHGEIAMYLPDGWKTLRLRAAPAADPISALDVSVLQDHLLSPVLGIADPRSDRRIDFVGGNRGMGELQRLVDAGKAAVAFSMFPVAVDDLMAVADNGSIMPPKSTWFEPKLRDGLLIHMI